MQNHNGDHVVNPLPYEYDALEGSISKLTNERHHDKHYAGYVKKRNECEEKLKTTDRSAVNANYSEYSELKRREVFNAAGQILHAVYYDVMGGDGNPDESLSVVQKLIQDFGSIQAWKEDFIAASKSAFGWTALCHDYTDGKLRNFVADAHNQGWPPAVFPLIPIDVYEHAYYADYGPDRGAYINGFLEVLNWQKIDEYYQQFIAKDVQIEKA